MEKQKGEPLKRSASNPEYDPIHDGDYTIEDYRKEWEKLYNSDKDAPYKTSEEWKKFGDLLESPLSEYPQEWSAYLSIHEKAMELWPNKRTWEDFDISGNLKKSATLWTYYELLEADIDPEEAIQKEIQHLNLIADGYEERSEYVPMMLQFIEEHPDYLEAATAVYTEIQKEEATQTKEPLEEINEKKIA